MVEELEAKIAYVSSKEDFFTEKALQELSDTAKGCPVNIAFDDSRIVGKIKSSKVENKKMFVTVEMNVPNSLVPLFLAPSGFKNRDGFHLVSVSATTCPTQKGLTQINKTEPEVKPLNA